MNLSSEPLVVVGGVTRARDFTAPRVKTWIVMGELMNDRICMHCGTDWKTFRKLVEHVYDEHWPKDRLVQGLNLVPYKVGTERFSVN